VRIVAATNRNLKNRIEDKEFREDLYYRLSVVTIELPPLREHREDIPLLLHHFLDKLQKRYNIPPLTVTEEALERLTQYNWPGNVRELENVTERLVVLSKTDTISEQELPDEIRSAETRIAGIKLILPEEGISLEEVEKELLLRSLEKFNGNQTHAAKYLNISRKTLIYRMEKYGLSSSIPLGS
jgi:two-component system NtrC family response regulator